MESVNVLGKKTGYDSQHSWEKSLSHYCLTESVYCIFYNNKLASFQNQISVLYEFTEVQDNYYYYFRNNF